MDTKTEFKGLEPYSFEWRGKVYNALGKWETNWVKWAMKNNPKALDTFIKNELENRV